MAAAAKNNGGNGKADPDASTAGGGTDLDWDLE